MKTAFRIEYHTPRVGTVRLTHSFWLYTRWWIFAVIAGWIRARWELRGTRHHIGATFSVTREVVS